MADTQLTVNCAVFSAKLTERACQANRERAQSVAKRIQKLGPEAVEWIRESDLEILAGCSQCEDIDSDLKETLIKALDASLNVLTDAVLTWEDTWYSDDPEVRRAKRIEAYQKYNAKPEVQVRERDRLRAKRAAERARISETELQA